MDEIFGLERGTADKSAVDFGLGEEFERVCRVDASAVLDSGCSLDFGREKRADESTDSVGLFGIADFSGSDCPNRFIGDNEWGKFFGGQSSEGAFYLGSDDSVGLASFPFGEGFSAADDWDESGGEGGFKLKIDRLVGFGEEGDGGFGDFEFAKFSSAFGVADDGIRASSVFYHASREESSEGAGLFPEDILGTYVKRRSFEGPGDGGDGKKRGADSGFDGQSIGDFFGEVGGSAGCLALHQVHLPVPYHDLCAHGLVLPGWARVDGRSCTSEKPLEISEARSFRDKR